MAVTAAAAKRCTSEAPTSCVSDVASVQQLAQAKEECLPSCPSVPGTTWEQLEDGERRVDTIVDTTASANNRSLHGRESVMKARRKTHLRNDIALAF